ncbi:MAG: antibiotic biosynthesis monooxygenase family protein [Anaerolineales bacterium]|jgi:heme-degrading monooxygenase HmoA
MIQRHVTFAVLPDKAAEFEKLFADEYRPAMASMKGFCAVDLLRREDQPLEYQMVIRFESAETAAGWRNSPAHQELKPRLKSLYSQSTLEVFDVIA